MARALRLLQEYRNSEGFSGGEKYDNMTFKLKLYLKPLLCIYKYGIVTSSPVYLTFVKRTKHKYLYESVKVLGI